MTQPVRSRRATVKKKNFSFILLPVSVWFVEVVAHISMFGITFDRSWFFLPLLSAAGGFLLAFFAALLPEKHSKRLVGVFLAVLGVFFSFYMVYYGIFRSFFLWQTLGLASAVTTFWKQTLLGILRCLPQVILTFLPLILFLIFKRTYRLPHRKSDVHVFGGALGAVLAILAILLIGLLPGNRSALANIRSDTDRAFRFYGIGLASTADLFDTIRKPVLDPVDNPYDDSDPTSDPTSDPEPEEPEPTVYHQLPIDFDALINSAPNNTIRNMHRYFASVPASAENEYTGMFKGKNLIVLCLEGFSDKVIDPMLTPTLYKMANGGFRFTNFYDTLWGGSTATGEYANMTGNFYSSATCLKKSGSTLTYSALGNQFRNAGYTTFAYHNNTYNYYNRQLSHPNFGYDYRGIGKGLTVPFNGWPRSDQEMAEATIDDYINSPTPFHAYYMTVSGHANFTWMGNSMSLKHRGDIPADSPYSENVKAYIACQIEVDRMLQTLVEKLDAAGKLNDTVFAMCCDHYPYALTDAELAELYKLPVQGIHNNFDLYRNGFILWCADMKEPITVDTPCSSYDIAPTLYNLFGLEYDSRLITGTDVLSDTENVVIINTLSTGGSWNWITTQGCYHTVGRKFTPSATCTMDAEQQAAYVASINKRVEAMKIYSAAILDNNYYKYVFDSNFQPLKTLPQQGGNNS